MNGEKGESDREALRELNVRIGLAENAGNRLWLAGILAPRFAFQRADPGRTVDDAESFLGKVKPGGDRETRVLDIQVHGDRAVVHCLVRSAGADYDNLRLFVRRDGNWKLLAWANEAVRRER